MNGHSTRLAGIARRGKWRAEDRVSWQNATDMRRDVYIQPRAKILGCTMTRRNTEISRNLFRALLGTAVLCAATPLWAASNYLPIVPTMNDRTVTLTGRDLTIDQIAMVARHGAKVELSPEARRQEADNYGLLLDAPPHAIPVHCFYPAPLLH